MDYGYHAPTLSFPIHGTLMVEPTESESLEELDRFVRCMESIYNEIMEVKEGKYPKDDNVLVNDGWQHPYTRVKAAYPTDDVRDNKFWLNVARVDNTLGDRHLLPTLDGRFD